MLVFGNVENYTYICITLFEIMGVTGIDWHLQLYGARSEMFPIT